MTETPLPRSPEATLRLVRFDDWSELESYAADWDRLAGDVPFRSWAWQSGWWRHYGPRKRLLVTAILAETGRVLAIAPWWIDRCPLAGRLIRFLGDEEVCSDYLGILCEPGRETAVGAILAQWLSSLAARDDHWDALEIQGVDAADEATRALVDGLVARGGLVGARSAPQCWRLDLPPTWDEYLAMLSKNRRKQVRQLSRQWIESGRAVFHTVDSEADLPRAMDWLATLHRQRHQRALGGEAFNHPRFEAFHRDTAAAMLAAGRLRLHYLEIEGRTVAAEYDLVGGDTIYAYQSGLDPTALALEPGNLLTIFTLRRAIEEGFRHYDFLRGDEGYKSHWRATPRSVLSTRVAACHRSARWRYWLWQTCRTARASLATRSGS